MRNLGDGFDDEECPERESWGWEMRSTRAPGVGIFITGTRSEPDPFKSGKKAWESEPDPFKGLVSKVGKSL